ncbi:MAG TPA: hypothetical protein VL524_04365 [Gemmatimonadaceae bacterium]|nr:hypothetical protein [Gemmatimonadaceae bacterium]
MSEIDWTVELRKIEREYDGLPPERSRTQIRLQKIREITAKERFQERLALVGLWAQLTLVGILAVSLFWWPYGHDCGFPLAAFLASQLMVIVGGVAVALRTWRDRLAGPFVGSTLFVVVAWTVIALHTLPRFGYPAGSAARATWSCRR